MNNKSNDLNPKNGIYHAYTAKLKSVTSKQAKELYQDRYFSDEYKAVFVGAISLKSIANFCSAITFGLAAYLAFLPLFGFYPAAIVGTFSSVLFEILKVYIWRIVSKNLLKYKRISAVAIAVLCALHLVSLLASVFGAWKLPTMTQANAIAVVKFVNVDSIANSYLPQIAAIDQVIQSQSKESAGVTSNSTKRTLANTIKVQAEQKNTILAAQKGAIEHANSKNKELGANRAKSAKNEQERRNKELEQQQIACVLVTVFFEVVLVLCSIFIAYYLFRQFIDDEAMTEIEGNEQAQKAIVQAPKTPMPGIAHEAPVRAVIKGFADYDGKRQDGKRQEVEKQALDYTRICELEDCQTPFIHAIHNQKYCTEDCRKTAYDQRKQARRLAAK